MPNTRAVLRRCLCVAALLAAVVAATANATPLPRQILFDGGETTVPFEDDDGNIQHVAPASFRGPSLWNIDGAVLSVASAIYYTGDDESFMESASQLSIDDGLTWTTQIAVKNKRVHPKYSRVMDATVVVKGKKAYVLVGSWEESTTNWAQQPNGDDWDALVAVGEIRRKTENGTTTAWMEWGKPISVRSALPDTMAGVRTTQFLGGVGNGLLMKNGTIVFPVQFANVEHMVAATVMYSADDGKTWHFGTGITPYGCTENNVIEWNGKLIINSRRDDGARMVLESSDMGSSWTETPLSGVWGNAPDRKGVGSQGTFITVSINGKEGILHAAPRNLQGAYRRDRLMLWLSNGDRVSLIGQISDGESTTGYSALSLLDGVLHAMHEMLTKDDNGNRSVMLRPLPEMTRQIEAVLDQWAAQDRLLASVHVPTNGLVGMLSGDADDGVWRDSYGCVDAETTGARKVADGLRFMGGRFGGAQWPVALQGQYQRYIFTRARFTLAASITVDEMTARNWNSPLGAALEASGEAKVLGLRYAIDGLWNPVYGYIYDRLTGSVREGLEYHVVLVFEDGVGRVYVDGKELEGAQQQQLRYVGAVEPNIEHFYIGGYMNGELDRDCRSTVRNVMLYNRVLSDEEIEALYMNHGKVRLAAAVQ